MFTQHIQNMIAYEEKTKMRQRGPGLSIHEVLPWQTNTVSTKTGISPGEKPEMNSFLGEIQSPTIST